MARDSVERLEKNYPDEKIEENYKEGREKIQLVLDQYMLQKEWQDKVKNLIDLIDHLNARVNYWEDRRTYFMYIGIGLAAAAIAGFLLVIQNAISFLSNIHGAVIGYSELFYASVISGLSAIGTFSLFVLFGSIRLMMKWSTQNNPSYPFTKGYKIWLWQYRFAEKTPSDTQIDEYEKNNFEEEVKKYCDNLYNYKKKFLEAGNDEIIDQHLSQIYLLLTNEKYKIKMVSALRNTLISTLARAVVFAILSGVIIFWITTY